MKFIFKAKVEKSEKGDYVKSPELTFNHSDYAGGKDGFRAEYWKLKKLGAEILKKGTVIYLHDIPIDIEIKGSGFFVEVVFNLTALRAQRVTR